MATLGFVGLGAMGSRLARRLLDARTRRRLQPHRRQGQALGLGRQRSRRSERGPQVLRLC